MIAATRSLPGQPPRVPDGVDDAGMTAAAQDHQAAVAHADHERLIVEDQRVGLPAAAVQCLVSSKPVSNSRRAVDLAGDQCRAVEQERRLALLDDLKAHALERRPAGRRQLARIQTREA